MRDGTRVYEEDCWLLGVLEGWPQETLPSLLPEALIAFNSKIDRATLRGEKLSLLGLNAFPSDIA